MNYSITATSSNAIEIAIFLLSVGALSSCLLSGCVTESEDSLESAGRHFIRSRASLWAKDICFSTVLLHLILYMCYEQTEDVLSPTLLIITLVASLYLDCRGRFEHFDFFTRHRWLLPYSLLTVAITLLALSRENEYGYLLFTSSAVSSIGVTLSALSIHTPVTPQRNEPTDEFKETNLLSFIMFSFMNNVIRIAQVTEKMEVEDLPTLCDGDTCEFIHEVVEKAGSKPGKSLGSGLIRLVWSDFIRQSMFQLGASLMQFFPPLALQRILLYVATISTKNEDTTSSSNSGWSTRITDSSIVSYWTVRALSAAGFSRHLLTTYTTDLPPLVSLISLNAAILLLFLGPVVQSVCNGQNYSIARRNAGKSRAALTSILYRRSITADLSKLQDGAGALNNLISVDVKEISESISYFHFSWSSALETALCLILLYAVVGISALGGVAVMLMGVPLGVYGSSKLSKYQKAAMGVKDERMAVVTEALAGIRIIKVSSFVGLLIIIIILCDFETNRDMLQWFAWESEWREKVDSVRKTELGFLRSYLLCEALFRCNWGLLPLLVGLATFLVHTQLLGRTLRASDGFTALLLFNLMRRPMGLFPEVIGMIVRAHISFKRILSFLDCPVVKGLSANKTMPVNSKSILKFDNVTLAWSAPVADFETTMPTVIPASVHSNSRPESGNILAKAWITLQRVVSLQLSRHNNISPISEKNRGVYERINAPPATGLGSPNPFSSPKRARAHSHVLITNDCHTIHNPIHFTIDCDEDEISFISDASADKRTANLSKPRMSRNVSARSTFTDGDAAETSREEVDEESSRSVDTDRAVLQRASFSLSRGSLTAVIGSTGAGKSTLISGILGECCVSAGSVSLATNTSISLVTQSAWIQNASLRDNILFGSPYNEQRYLKVLEACALVRDLEQLPDGDLTDIGEKGVNLSGGQQQRVSLARAAYSMSDLIILDDPLSAVDAHVCDHIFNHLVLGFLKCRTRLLVTHQVALVLPEVDQVICLDGDGGIAACCPPKMLSSRLQEHMLYSRPSSTGNSKGFLEMLCAVDMTQKSVQNCLQVSAIPESLLSPRDNLATRKETMLLVEQEGRSTGDIGVDVYWFYLKACGGICAAVSILMLNVLVAISWVLNSISLGHWMEMIELKRSAYEVHTAMLFYILSVVACLFVVASLYVYQAYGSLEASRALHDRLLVRVLHATLSWYDSQPSGRKINRFSQDISTVDSQVMSNLADFLDCLVSAIQVILVISVLLPAMIPFMLPIVIYNFWVSNRYIKASRELKRLESVSRSPVFALQSETLNGLSIVRAFKHEERFFGLCCKYTDVATRCHLYLWMVNRWLNMRTQLAGAIVTGSVALGVVINAESLGSTLAGLILVYAMNFTDSITYMTRMHGECQMSMNSVERVKEYCLVDQEQYLPSNDKDDSVTVGYDSELDDALEMSTEAGKSWPRSGEVEFRNVHMRYRPSDPPVLKGVSFVIPGGFKVGVVGRSGAGKSSLISALFRTIEPCGGKIILDGQDLQELPLKYFRSRIAIVPQEPILFKDSLRANLDPFNEHSDADLWSCLEQVHMGTAVAALAKGGRGGSLHDIPVAVGGSNFSVGQRQLLCMCRALLREARVLVLDEATASVDAETDGLIQLTVRQALSNITVISIAHRLHTVAYYDRVIVMDAGQLVEYDSPAALLRNKESLFWSMCERSGDLEAIKASAAAAANQAINEKL